MIASRLYEGRGLFFEGLQSFTAVEGLKMLWTFRHIGREQATACCRADVAMPIQAIHRCNIDSGWKWQSETYAFEIVLDYLSVFQVTFFSLLVHYIPEHVPVIYIPLHF